MKPVLSAPKNSRALTREVLSGLVVGLALIPEAIAILVFSSQVPHLLGVPWLVYRTSSPSRGR